MALQPKDHAERVERHKAWQERRRAAARKYADKRKRKAIESGKYSSVRPVNRERRKAETERAYGPPERRAWVKTLPCIVCGETPSDNAHIEGGGMGRKADADRIVPLCRRHHTDGPDSFHALGSQRAFNDAHKLDLDIEADMIDQRWKEGRL